MDRWRKLPFGPMASYMHPEEGIGTSALHISQYILLY